MEHKEEIALSIPLTIEKQLENYSKREGHSDRHETLWHAWYQNKRWISEMLQVTLHSFPTYSRHDETHALSVLNNIEMLLGQERIAELSATDCFVLLHTVYIHDIGMCITQQDRKDIIENEQFIDMLDWLQTEGDETVKRAIECLKRTDYHCEGKEEYLYQMKQLYRAKLDVYYAIVELVADYRRSEHGNKSAERLYDWTMKPEKLGIGFSMAGVPLRIFLAIARCAQMHTCGQFEDVKTLPQKDGGYASDYYHPRFISVLLMLGDILDMDNDRFHPMVLEFVEDFSDTSRNHYDKHRSIRKLHISPSKIEIEADCTNQNALRLVRKECDMLADTLRSAGYIWSEICPEGFRGSLPSLGEVNLYLEGKQIPEELVTAQFSISQKKAFSILEGSNLYEGRFVFLREFLQNAIDASKMQYWYDYAGMASYYLGDGATVEKSPDKMNQELPLDKYPVEIGMKMQKRDFKGKNTDISEEDIKKIEAGQYGDYEFGILVSVKDFGTGIDKESILAISTVGNSRSKDHKIIQKMPRWLRPTAEFGVGLQSAFLLTESFKCYTHTRSGERYEITFSSGSSSRYEGYINVVPIEKFSGKHEAYGTCFEVFVPLEKKFLHSESICTWSGSDPFGEDYDTRRVFRHAAELISQMALYLDRMLGEILFPVILKVNDKPYLQLALNTKKDNKICKMVYPKTADWKKEYKKSWIFRKNTESQDFLFGDTENVIFALEYDSCRLYLWNKEIDAFCVVSGSNLLKREEEYRKKKQSAGNKHGITVYYKGIELQCKCIEEEIDMFEYIDIKGDLKRPYINISRRGFTPEGTQYFEKMIYQELINSAKLVLKYINHLLNSQKANINLDVSISKKICELAQENRKEDASFGKNEKEYYDKIGRLADQLLTVSFLAHLALKDVRDEMSELGTQCGQEERCVWQETIKKVNATLTSRENKCVRDELEKCSILFDIECYECIKDRCVTKKTNILEIFLQDRHYGIFQVRENEYGKWVAYIFSVDRREYELCEYTIFGDSEKIKNENEEMLNKWCNMLFEAAKDIGETVSEEHKYEQQFLLTWLTRNMPVIGIFSNQDGHKRFNILSNYILPCIYTNENHKLLIMKRILETAKNEDICRFSTFAWQGRQYLAVRKAPFSCYFVKRGFLNRGSLHKIIFPLDRKSLNDIGEILENTENHEFIKNVRRLAEFLDCKAYFAKLVRIFNEEPAVLSSEEREVVAMMEKVSAKHDMSITSVILGMNEFMADILNVCNRTVSNRNRILNDKYFEEMRTCEIKWHECCIKIMKFYLKLVNDTDEEHDAKGLCQDSMVRFISRGWLFIQRDLSKESEIEKHLQITQVKEKYLAKCEENPELSMQNGRILSYIHENARYPIRTDNLKRCYIAFIKEVFSLFENIEKRNIQMVVKNILTDTDLQRTIK